MHNSTMKISNAQCLGTPSYLPTYFFPLLPILVRLFSFTHGIHHRVFNLPFQARRARQMKILPFVDVWFRLFHPNSILPITNSAGFQICSTGTESGSCTCPSSTGPALSLAPVRSGY